MAKQYIHSYLKKKISFLFGHFAEYLVIVLLSMRFFKIIARRFFTRFGEIDVIASKGKKILFIEVKFRFTKSNLSFSIDNLKVKKIIKTSEIFLKRNPVFYNYNIEYKVYLLSFFYFRVENLL